ncbi:MAG: ABC transporter ATP-binding protein [Coriobacteriales bacterium]|jgi:ABC-type lipoprotein export system ATPase subunit|nr:ABC transporter ATP-binding protein [Coriobacteriales bacterium]
MSGVRKTYDGRRYVLDGLDFTLHEGQVAAILGASGCGKSTLLNIIGLLDSCTEGSYTFCGERMLRTRLNSYHQQRARDIGFVFQSYCLIDALSVTENALMPFLYNDRSITREVERRLVSVLDDFNLTALKNTKASLLSGGERQRVAIARAMIKSPRLVIADEPTGNLDDANARLVVEAFLSIARQGTSVVVVTHNNMLADEVACAYRLCKGRLEAC